MQIVLTQELWQEVYDFYKNKSHEDYNNYLLEDVNVWAYKVKPDSREHLILNIEPETPIFELCKSDCIPVYSIVNNSIFDTIKYKIVSDERNPNSGESE